MECLINLHDGVGKETELHSFHKKCESIRKAYKLDDEDCDTVDGIMDELRLFLLLRKPLHFLISRKQFFHFFPKCTIPLFDVGCYIRPLV